ncbi:hypothetical protein Tco_0703689 [Tanacetum coccineum]|uniref:Uncharacterized protein n=1 Tax=Tanacetum coccineum TaxID=301880 RepID=A0ABQ4Y1H6_9ASTR
MAPLPGRGAHGVEVRLTMEIVGIVPMCGCHLSEGFCPFCKFKAGNSFVYDSNPNSFNNLPNVFTHPPQPQYETYSYGNDSHYGYDFPPRFSLIKDYRNEKIDIRFRRECESLIDELKGKFNGMSIEINKKEELQYLEQVTNLSTYPSQHFKSFCYDDDDDYDYEASTIPLNEIDSQIPLSMAITPVLPTLELENSLIIGDEHLSTIPEKESDEFIKSSVEDFVPIPSESEDTFGSNSECDLSSNDESLSDEDILDDSVKIYPNPLFKFDNEYIFSDVNPLFDEVLEDIEIKDSYVSNLDEPALLVTPLSDFNEDECFDPGGEINEIDAFLDINISTDIENGYHNSEGDIIYLESLLINDTISNFPPDVFLDHDPRSLKDELDKEDLKSMIKVFDPDIHKNTFSPTYVRLPFEDRHYLSLTYVIRIFLPYFTYPVESSLPLSSGSEDIIFDPDISAFHFSFLEPVAYEYPIEDCPDYEDSCARGFVHRSLDLQSFACLYLGIQYPRSY